jgi:iron complex transport system substrate-binding protein
MKKLKNTPLYAAIGLGLIFTALYFMIFSWGDGISSKDPQARAGKTKGEYHRIICASPSVTEIVFALGFGEHIVGVSDFTFYPPEAKQIASIGGIINPHKERIINLQPGLIIFQGKHDSLARFCHQKQIPYLSIPIDSLQDISDAIRTLGKKLGVAARAEQLIADFDSELQELRAKTTGLFTPRVFLSLGHTPGDLSGIMTTGPGTFLHELVLLAGGQNLFDDATGLYPQISKEVLIKRQPDIIIEVLAEGITPKNQDILRKDWERLADLPAVEKENIHFISDDFLLIPSLRVVQTAKKLIRIIHPEILEKSP